MTDIALHEELGCSSLRSGTVPSEALLNIQAARSLSEPSVPDERRWPVLRSLASQHISLRRGETPTSTGTSGSQCFHVLEGTLRIWRALANGRRQITAFAFPGDWAGFDDVGEHNVRIEAVTPGRAERYHLRNIHMAVAADAAVGAELQELLRSRIKAAQERILVLGHKNTREKLASFILEMTNRLAEGGNTVELPMSRHDIADYLGMSPETTCRNFTNFVSDRIIALPAPNVVQILQRGSLEFIAI